MQGGGSPHGIDERADACSDPTENRHECAITIDLTTRVPTPGEVCPGRKTSATPDCLRGIRLRSSCRSSTLASMRHEAWAGAGSPIPHAVATLNLCDPFCWDTPRWTVGGRDLKPVWSDTVAPGRGGGRRAARPPGAPCRHLRSPAAPGKHRGPARPRTGGTGSTPARSRPSRQRPGTVCRHRDAQRDDHRRLGERLAVQHEGHNVLPGEVPLLEFAEFRRAGLNERAGHRRPRVVPPSAMARDQMVV